MFDLLSSQSSQLYSFSFWNIKACILAKCYFPLKIFSLNNIICVFLNSLLRLIQTQQILQNINSGCCLFGKFTFLPLEIGCFLLFHDNSSCRNCCCLGGSEAWPCLEGQGPSSILTSAQMRSFNFSSHWFSHLCSQSEILRRLHMALLISFPRKDVTHVAV